MMIGRRTAILGGASTVLLAGCFRPPALTVSAEGVTGMNPAPDGTDRPLTLTIVQMRGTSAFDAADFFALQNPQAALGGEFVKAERLVLSPGSSASRKIGIEDGVTTVGIVAGFRDPVGKAFRLKIPAPSGPKSAVVGVSPAGISLMRT